MVVVGCLLWYHRNDDVSRWLPAERQLKIMNGNIARDRLKWNIFTPIKYIHKYIYVGDHLMFWTLFLKNFDVHSFTEYYLCKYLTGYMMCKVDKH